MKTLILNALAIVGLSALLASGQAFAKEPAQASPMQGQAMPGHAMPMKPPTPCPQDLAIAPVFSGVSTWTGDIPAGAMGPNSLATKSEGRAECQKMLNGLWYSCDVHERMGAAPNFQDWRGHFMVGFDRNANQYKATLVDNMGTSLATFDGNVSGNKLTLETPNEVTSPDQQRYKDRLTFDFTDPKNIAFTNERQMSGGSWQLFERATMHPQGAMRQARTPRRSQ